MKKSCFKGCFCSKDKIVILNLFQDLHRFKSASKEEMLKRVQHDNRRRAFTLIELLVVVLIIGILAAVALPQYQKAVLKSRFATVKEMTQSLVNAEEIYYLANNKYTADFEELDVSLPPSEDEETGEEDSYKDFGTWRCGLHYKSTSGSFVYCAINQQGEPLIALQIYLHYSGVTPGAHRCVAQTTDLNDKANKVCQSETNKEAPSSSYSGNTFKVWKY